MKIYSKIILFGFLLWLSVFLSSFVFYSIKQSNPTFFETLITITLTFFTILFTVLYFKKIHDHYVKYGVITGISWLLINIAIDLCLFSWGPMKMTFVAYMGDIGLTYLTIPITTMGIGYLLKSRE